MLNRALLGAVGSALVLSGCAAFEPDSKPEPAIYINEDPYPSTYVRYPGVLTVIRHATVFTGDGQQINGGTIVFSDGVIQAVGGPDLASPEGALEIDGTGKFSLTPGIIRCSQPPRRLSIARCQRQFRRQRGDVPGAAGSLGGA